MRFLLIFGLWVSSAFASDLKIADWREVDGLSEAEAVRMTEAAINNYLTVDEDGVVCPVDEIWGLERDRDLVPDFPEKGEVFAVTGYAHGPDVLCERSGNYDCRVSFLRTDPQSAWKVDHVFCEALF